MKSKHRHARAWCSAAVLIALSVGEPRLARSQDAAPVPITNSNETATDALGRTLPDYEEVGPPKPGRWVGVFYWLWHGKDRWLPDYNVSEFLKTHPRFRHFEFSPAGGPKHPTWYWGEPLFGYYRSTDAWVMRKHLVMLADAGVDFVFMDYTNSPIYDEELQVFLRVAQELKTAGLPVPKITFFLNHAPEWKVHALYTKWFKPGQHDDLWFQWKGKPLLMAPRMADVSKLKPGQDPALAPEIEAHFTWRPTWAYEKADKTPGMWRFVTGYAQPVATDAEGKPEQMVVNKSTGGPIHGAFKEGGVSAVEGIERKAGDYDEQWRLPDYPAGVFFQDHWDHAMKVAPPILLVTGWNEWKASVWNQPGVKFLGKPISGPHGYFVDQFNVQFNRDLEPMKDVEGGTFDHYYWQFVANMRRYKGMAPPQAVSAPKTIRLGGGARVWSGVAPVYSDAPNDGAVRDSAGSPPKLHYKNTSARNDIHRAQVARDARHVYFRVETTGPPSPATGQGWMTLYLDTDANPATGWNGYDARVNASRQRGTCSLERNVGGQWKWEGAGVAPIAASAREIEVALPRAFFPGQKLRFDFKWADHLPDVPTVSDFYTEGDVAPDARFNFRYVE